MNPENPATPQKIEITEREINVFKGWQQDWCKFARDVFSVTLDPEQKEILKSVQTHKMVSVASGTARGKDFVAAVAALCFLYLTPKFNSKGELVENTKVAMTAPTGRQVLNIMHPEIVRLFNSAKVLPGRLVSCDVRTDYAEWFLTGFKAEDNKTEVWSGFHAVNTMFIVTEASGISEETFAAIEGNLQANSKILIVFNPNSSIGYAARSMTSPRWKSFRLDDLTAPNVVQKQNIIPGQVDYDWVKDKVETWCIPIHEDEIDLDKGDFEFERNWYRPNDLFRVKVRGMFPEVSEDSLIPLRWVELANERWNKWRESGAILTGKYRRGVDVAGMGRDSTVSCDRVGDVVKGFGVHQSAGKADHMQIAGNITRDISIIDEAFIDTIGEGSGVYSRLVELGFENKVYSVKFSESALDLHDITGQLEFANMRAYLFWAVRDWLNPVNKIESCLPPDQLLTQELIEVKYIIQSNGKIIIEPKDDIKVRLGRSIDRFDALANTFYPHIQSQTRVFPDGSLRTYSKLPQDEKNEKGETIINYFIIAFARAADESMDYFAMPIAKVYPENKIYIIDAIFEPNNLILQKDQIQNKITEHNIKKLAIETNREGASFIRRIRTMLQGVEVFGQYAKSNKREMVRILANAGLVKMYFYFPENPNPVLQAFMNQMYRLMKTSTKENDAADAVTGLAAYLERYHKLFKES